MPINHSMLTYHLSNYYGPGKSILLTRNGQPILPVPPQTLADIFTISDLSDKARVDDDGEPMRDAEGKIILEKDAEDYPVWKGVPEDGKIAIDPILGRIAF